MDEFPDVPFAKDLYEEAIPEVSEYREGTIFPYSQIDNSLIEGTLRQTSLRYGRDRETLKRSGRNIEERSKIIDATF